MIDWILDKIIGFGWGEWLLRNGRKYGFVLIVLPIVYDLVGILYGKDPQIKVSSWGVMCQVVGSVLMYTGDKLE